METSISHGNGGAGTFQPLQTGGDFAASHVHGPVSPVYVFMWREVLSLDKEADVIKGEDSVENQFCSYLWWLFSTKEKQYS